MSKFFKNSSPELKSIPVLPVKPILTHRRTATVHFNDNDIKIIKKQSYPSLLDILKFWKNETEYSVVVDGKEKIIILCNVLILAINFIFYIYLLTSQYSVQYIDNDKNIASNILNIDHILSYIKVTLGSIMFLLITYKTYKRISQGAKQIKHNLDI